jgi:hypothetical protein
MRFAAAIAELLSLGRNPCMRTFLLLILLGPVLWGGCIGSVPSAGAWLRLPLVANAMSPSAADPEIDEAVGIIDSLLKQNGFLLESELGDPKKFQSRYTKFYARAHLRANLVVRFEKGSRVAAVFVMHSGPHFRPSPETLKVRDEIFQKLVQRFGSERVTSYDHLGI